MRSKFVRSRNNRSKLLFRRGILAGEDVTRSVTDEGESRAARRLSTYPPSATRMRATASSVEAITRKLWFASLTCAPSPLCGMRRVARSATALSLVEVCATRQPPSVTSDLPSPVLLRLARQQRANAVQAEAIIWRAIRDRRCEGAKFRRQVAIGNFIVDFVCFDRRLIVKVDGPSHQGEDQQMKDRERDGWLTGQGFRVLRLANELVIASTELAVARIRAALGE
jgi:very-short-patch-repair endonuclease